MGQACARAPSVDGLGRELIVQERNQEGQGGAGARHEVRPTSRLLLAGESTREGLGDRLLIKFVLLVEVPGDLSDHGVGVAHKAEAVLQQPKKAGEEE